MREGSDERHEIFRWHRRRCPHYLGEPYVPEAAPAMWRRVADCNSGDELLDRWGPLSLGHLHNDEKSVQDHLSTDDGRQYFVSLWQSVASRMEEVADLWDDDGAGIYKRPRGATESYVANTLRRTLTRLTLEENPVRFRGTSDGLVVRVFPQDLEAFLWLTTADDLRVGTRFRRCDRCREWFPIKRTDAMFCSATCRNYRPKESDNG